LGQRLAAVLLGPEVAHQRGGGGADGAATGGGRGGRHLGHRQHLVGGHDDAPVDLEARKGPGLRAGGDDDRVGGEGDPLAAVVGVDGDGAPGVEPPVAVVDGDLAPLQQRGDAGDELVDDGLLALLGGRPVDLGRAGADAEVAGRGHGAVDVRGLEQLLGGDAPHVEAGAAEPALLDECDLEPGAGAVERGRVAAGAAADGDDVVVLGRGDHLQGELGRAGVAADSTGRGPAAAGGAGPPAAASAGEHELHAEGHEDGQATQEGGDDQAAGAHTRRSGYRPRSDRPEPGAPAAAPAPGPPGPATVRGRMTDLASYRRRLQSRLAELAAELRVPGAACGVLERGETVVVTTGVANVATRAPVTPDTLFQIGSITKI